MVDIGDLVTFDTNFIKNTLKTRNPKPHSLEMQQIINNLS